MAEVYKAYHPDLDRYVAIKALHPFLAEEEDFLARFQREARIVATFRHPNIIQVYDFDFDVENRRYYMVMEYIDGLTLKDRLRELAQTGDQILLEEAIHIVAEIANALDYAHQHGMVHRDIKPANIMFTQDGQIILSDFGIARIVDTTNLTASGAMVGTPAYMAPEQGIGQAGDERADIYSLGVVLYQLATGMLPFDADTPLGVVLKHINTPLKLPSQINPEIPENIETVIIRALAKGPNNRYQTAREFADDLKKALNGEAIEPISPELAMQPTLFNVDAQLDESHTLQGGKTTARIAISPKNRRSRIWQVALGTILLIILMGSMLLLQANYSIPGFNSLVSLFVQTTRTVTHTPTVTHTSTPDLDATQDVLSTRIAAGLHAGLATRDAQATHEASLKATLTPVSTPTPDRTATAMAVCIFDMEISEDQTIRPSILMPEQEFQKIWQIKNTGTCVWPERVHLRFASGEELDVIEKDRIPPLEPGESTKIAITLRAPAAFGEYVSAWQIEDNLDHAIGEKFKVSIVVGPTPTPPRRETPTPTPTRTPAPAFTATPMEPLRIDSAGIVPGTFREIGNGEWEADIYVVARGGNGEYRFYRDIIDPEAEFFAPNPEEPWVGVQHGARWKICLDMRVSFWITSAGMQAHWDIPIPYPRQSECGG